MIETIVHSIRVEMHSHNRLVILKEVHGDRHLPIWIGDFEAQAIAIELQGVESPRPLPYDVLETVISELGGSVDRVLVVDLAQDVYYARIIIAAADRSIELDSRPSDAIALAVRVGVPIYVDESVMDRAGVSLESDDESGDSSDRIASTHRRSGSMPDTSADDERLSVFREFINTLDPEDQDRSSGN